MSKPCVAHSFSSLIQIVLSGIRLANPAVGDPERLKRILADIRTAAAQRAGLTEHLLAFSQDLPTEPKAVDTAEHIRRAVDLFGRSLHGKIRIDIDLEDDLWPVQVDAAQFDLALLNAALNARDAMPEGGLLEVSTRNVTLDEGPTGLIGRAVAIRLRDTGIGIPRGVLGRVFVPFFTTKAKGEGTRLGLNQAYGFAERAGGALRIQSKPGKGTVVTFLLLAASDEIIEPDEPISDRCS